MHISGIKERHAEGNRLRHSASVLLALAAALAVLLVGNVDVGQAQTAASLIEVEGGGTQIGFDGERALGFRTAASAGTGNDGWVVTEVELRIRPDDGTGANRTATPPGLEICEATNSGDPDPNGTCFPLTAPGTVQVPTAMTNGQEVTYTATGNGHFLATGTEYTLHFTENGSTNAGDVHHLDASTNDGEAVSVAGAFANVMRELRSDDTWGPSSSSVAWARITGYASTTPPESQVLVSNIGQGGSSSSTFSGLELAQAFTTGDSDAGYALTSIELLVSSGANAPTVTLHSGSATGTKVADFTRPSGVSNGSTPFTFTSITTVTLSANTEYWVVARDSNGAWTNTSQDAEDAGAESGWSIANVGQSRSAASTGNFADRTNGYAYKLRVNGTVTPPPPVLISNIGQVPEDTPNSADKAQPFRTGANPAGYTVKSIEMQTNALDTTPAAYPAVTLRSGSATGTLVGTPAKPSGSSVSGILTYTFDTTVPLAASTTYWVVTGSATTTLQWYVFGSDATDAATASGWTIPGKAQEKSGASFVDFAGNAYFQISVRGVRSNSATTGAPSITAPNVFRVPAALGVDLSGIVDTNGVTRIATTATYKWQRFGADGTTLETDSIGTRSTYTLTDADAGKTLKVVVSFRDDDGHPEGPLTSVATAAITPAASCVVPTLVGGAVFLGPARKLAVEKAGSSPLIKYGFSKVAGVGSLDNVTFTTAASNDYEITTILTDTGGMVIQFDMDLIAVDKNTLVLHICDQADAFGPKTTRAESSYRFESSFGTEDRIWRDYAERTIYLSQDTAAPTLVEARVNGTSLVMTFNEELGAAASLANGAFTVKKGSGGTTQTLSGSPSISGSTVTLTLATAVSATDTDVKVSYTKPTTGTANKLLDTFGNEVATFTADQDVGNQLADNTPPELVSSNAAVLARDGLTLTLTFNEALKTSSVPAAAAFTVKATPAGATEAVVDLASSGAVTVSGSTVVLKLGIPITHNDGSANVSYAKPGTGAVIEDTNGNDAADFTNRPASNNSAVPRVSIARVHADASPGIAHAEFTVTRSNISASALTVNISITQADTYLASTTDTITIPVGQTTATKEYQSYYEGNTSGDLTATVSEGTGYVPAVTPNNAATVRMKVPTSGRTLTISHQQGNYLVTEGDGTVSIGATLTTGDASAEPRETVSLLIDTTDGTAKSGNPSDFVQVAGQIMNVQPGNWTASGTAYTATSSALILIENDDEYEGSEQFNVIIGPDSTHAIFNLVCPPGTQASRGCLATVTITDDETLEVSDVEVTSTPTGGYYDLPGNIDFTATLNGKVNVTGSPEFAFELGGETRQAEYAMGASNTTGLVFRYELATGDGDDHDGISWGANALSLNGGMIKFMHTDAAQQVNANLNHAAQGALPGHKVDTTKPSLEEAEHDDTILSLTFTEDLNTTAPANTAFTVKVDGGTGTNPTAVSIAGEVVTLTLATAITSGQTVTVSYTKPSSNPIKDLSGKEADDFTDRNVDSASDIVNFRATPGNRRVTLSWDNPNDSTINRYQYRFMNTSDSVWNPDWRNISGQRLRHHVIHGDEPDQRHRVHLPGASGDPPGRAATYAGQGGTGEFGAQGFPGCAPQHGSVLRRRRRDSADLGRPERHHDNGLPVPPPEHIRQRLEPGLDGHIGQRCDDDLAYAIGPDQLLALHFGGARPARWHGRSVGPGHPKAPGSACRAGELCRGFRRKQAGDA